MILEETRHVFFDQELNKKSKSLISAVSIYFVSQYQNLFIPVREIYKYFKIPYNTFNKFCKVIDKKYNNIENILIKDPDDSWLDFLFQ